MGNDMHVMTNDSRDQLASKRIGTVDSRVNITYTIPTSVNLHLQEKHR